MAAALDETTLFRVAGAYQSSTRFHVKEPAP
jgi:hypothetical protein